VKFIKLHGCGNSFIIVWDPPVSLELSAWAKRICDPHFGIGSDGMMIVRPPPNPQRAHFDVQMINPDGSDMGMCGNGIRCVVRFLAIEERVPPAQMELKFIVGDRLIRTSSKDGGRWVRVDMGAPSEIRVGEFSIENASYRFVGLSMGNPHCVISGPDLITIDLPQIGPRIECHQQFPDRTNTEFVQRESESRVRVLVWERGAGATLACGTGACATAVAMIRYAECVSPLTVVMPGGELIVEWDGGKTEGKKVQEPNVYLSGPTQEVCQGEILCSDFRKPL